MKPLYMLLITLMVLVLTAGSGLADDWDNLFDDDPFASEVFAVDEAADVDHSLALLTSDSMELGGSARFALEYSAPLEDISLDGDLRASVRGQVYLDARPRVDTRFLARADYTLDSAADDPFSWELAELFLDWNYDNSVYFRAGKQTVRWGVGYFFSPADVISVGRLDPEKPEAVREGPVALRVHVPQRRQDYHLFLLFDGVDQLNQIAVAPRATFVVGRSEIGVGGFYQEGKVPRGMLTVSTSLGGVDIFGEAVLSRGSDRTFVEVDDDLNLVATTRDELLFQGTVGLQFSRPDPEGLFSVGLAAQYFYNGEGYEDRSVLNDPRLAFLLLGGDLKLSDLLPFTSRHYGAAAVNWNDMLNSRFSTSAFWLGNLSDSSGQVTTSVSHRGWGGWRPNLGISWFYGAEGTEFGWGVNQAVASLSYSVSF